MERKWTIIYFIDENNNCEVLNFIEKQKKRDQIKIFNWLTLLERDGPTLPRPYAAFLRNGIHELRLKLSGNQYRILYFFCFKDFIIFTHAFLKKTRKVPTQEIEKAIKIKEYVFKTFNEKNIKENLNEKF